MVGADEIHLVCHLLQELLVGVLDVVLSFLVLEFIHVNSQLRVLIGKSLTQVVLDVQVLTNRFMLLL